MTLGKYLLIFGLSGISFLTKAQIECTEVTLDAGIDFVYSAPTYMGGGAAFFDYDNDGDDDLWIAGGVNRDVLYENDGSGQFSEIGEAAGLNAANNMVSSGVITGDLDNDGYRDVLVTPHVGQHPLLFKNNGDGTFTEISEAAGLATYNLQTHAAAMGDINKDGFLDIYLATYIENINNVYDGNGIVVGFDHDCFDNLLFINNGDWTFTELAETYGVKNGGCALATMFTDYNQDTDADILIANDFGAWITPNALYQNDYPDNTFSDIGQVSGMDVGIYGMGIAVGDYDRDLDLDYYITNLGHNVLMDNQNDGTFTDRSIETGTDDTYMLDSLLAVGWGTAFMDMDNDADLDLFVCNGFVPAAPFILNTEQNKNRLFINDGNETGTGFNFTEVAINSELDNEGRGRGFAYSDYDNDGDLDLLVINVNQHTSNDPIENVLLFRNDSGNENNWLQVDLEGITSNRDAFGAVIKIVVGDHAWLHDYNGGYGSHNSQHGSIAHFGLHEAEIVDSLIVTWPSGTQSHFADIDANQKIKITEDGILTNTQVVQEETLVLQTFPNPFTEELHIQFQLSKREKVEIEVFDLLGRKVDNLFNESLSAGIHQINWKPSPALEGNHCFVLRLKSNHQIITKNLIQIH